MSDDKVSTPDTMGVGMRTKNLKRRSSIQKIIHMCNQSYQVFPYVFLWVQDFQTSIQTDLIKIITTIKSFLVLRLGVYLSLGLILTELLYFLIITATISVPSGLVFLLGCIGVLSAMAFRIFNVLYHIRKALRGSVKKKIQ